MFNLSKKIKAAKTPEEIDKILDDILAINGSDKEVLVSVNNFVQIEYTNEQRLEVLKMLYQQLHSIHTEDEKMESRATISTTTLFFAFSAYILEKSPLSASFLVKISFSFFVLLIMVLCVSFLISNGNRIKLDSRLIVRVETALGLYSRNAFLIPGTVQDGEMFNNNNKLLTSLFPKDIDDWGKKNRFHYIIPHLLVVILSGIISLFVLFSS